MITVRNCAPCWAWFSDFLSFLWTSELDSIHKAFVVGGILKSTKATKTQTAAW